MSIDIARQTRHRPETVLEQNRRIEIGELHRELHEIGNAHASARALYAYVTVLADSPEAEQHAALIYYLTGRAQRRHGEDGAA